jgi:hypothetical protein
MHITIVGHPESRLKKWTAGQVVDVLGNWFSSTAYILPGDSGSPVLDDTGNLVGLIHRSPTGQDLISSDGVNVMAIGTASGPIQTAIAAAARPSAMISLVADNTAVRVVAADLVYLNGGAATTTVGGAPTDGATNTLDWLNGYRQRAGYQDYGISIASAYVWWWQNGALEKADALAALSRIKDDPHVSASGKLYADLILYEEGK